MFVVVNVDVDVFEEALGFFWILEVEDGFVVVVAGFGLWMAGAILWELVGVLPRVILTEVDGCVEVIKL